MRSAHLQLNKKQSLQAFLSKSKPRAFISPCCSRRNRSFAVAPIGIRALRAPPTKTRAAPRDGALRSSRRRAICTEVAEYCVETWYSVSSYKTIVIGALCEKKLVTVQHAAFQTLRKLYPN